MLKRIAAATVAASLLTAPAAQAGRTSSVADQWKARIAREARAHGVDARALFRSTVVIETIHSDGRVTTTRTNAARAVEQFARAIPLQRGSRAAEPGPGGTPEIAAGDLTHLYATVGLGATHRYTVTRSAVVPSTPAVTAASPAFTEYGGPLTQVKGSGWTLGTHAAGIAAGGVNVDTAGSGPYAGPVKAGIVTDRSIDFVGHGTVTQARLCFFGLCFASFGLLVGDGVALFDNTTPATIPLIP